MDKDEIKGQIISLAVIGAGIWIVMQLSKSYISSGLPGIPAGLNTSIDSLGTIMLYGIGALVALLIAAYMLSKSAKPPGTEPSTQFRQ